MSHSPPHARASVVLAEMAAERDGPTVEFGHLLDLFERRAFGILLIFATLPALIPSPVGAGLIAGPLVVMIGAQLVWGREHPWLPQWLRHKGISRASLGRFVARAGRWLARLERLCRPRWPVAFGLVGVRLTGVLLIGHGIALSLPIPFTNYPFAAVLLVLAIALLEEDGLFTTIAWLGMAAAIAIVTGVGMTLLELWTP
jgi:hypothetical protein